MKRISPLLFLLALLAIACNLLTTLPMPQNGNESGGQAGPTLQSERRCGDGVCDGPENPRNCPQDCSRSGGDKSQPAQRAAPRSSDYGLLYQVIENIVTTNQFGGTTCYSFGFLRFLDAGYIQPDGSGNLVLKLKDHPTSRAVSQVDDRYFVHQYPE